MTSTQRGNFLLYSLKLMKFICLWPLESNSTFVLYLHTTSTVLMLASLSLASVGQTIEIFISPNISSMASAIDLATLTASALFKMVYILWYRADFRSMVDKIDSRFVESDSPANTVRMADWMKNSKFFINVYMALAAIAILPVAVLPYLTTNYFFLDELTMKDRQLDADFDGYSVSHPSLDNTTVNWIVNPHLDESLINNFNSPKSRKHPINCWFPFDVTWSPLYEIIYLFELTSLYSCVSIYIVSDSFFFMIIYLVCGQLEILKATLRSLQNKNRPTCLTASQEENDEQQIATSASGDIFYQTKQVQREMDQAIVKCIDFHSDILSVIHDLDLLLRSLIVVDVLHAVISLSFAMLQTIAANSVYKWFEMILFISVSILHQFLNNFFCEILIQQQLSVAEAAYDTPWTTGSRTLQTAVLMAIRQARHYTRLSGWKMYQMGLGTFVEFMKLLGSYFLVLQSLHAAEMKNKSK